MNLENAVHSFPAIFRFSAWTLKKFPIVQQLFIFSNWFSLLFRYGGGHSEQDRAGLCGRASCFGALSAQRGTVKSRNDNENDNENDND